RYCTASATCFADTASDCTRSANLEVNIDVVEQRPAVLAEIALNHRRRAAALASRIAVQAALAPAQLSTVLLNGCIDRHRDGRHSPFLLLLRRARCLSSYCTYSPRSPRWSASSSASGRESGLPRPRERAWRPKARLQARPSPTPAGPGHELAEDR